MMTRYPLALTGPALGVLMMLACSENGSGVNTPGSAGTSSAGQGGGASSVGGGGVSSGGVNGGGVTATGGSSSAAGSSASGTSAGGAAAGAAGSSAAAGGSAGGSAGAAGASGAAGTGGAATTERFSFFVTSLVAIRRESGSMDGFGGDLGGLTGADALCSKIAEQSMAGSGAKGWRAFLSTTTVNAISRIGQGPWYDRTGRVVAMNIAGLLNTRPAADDAIADDLPNENGVPNRAGTGGNMDNHDTITASNAEGQWDGGSTCDDWTSATGTSVGPRLGHSWPAQGSGNGWIAAHTALNCTPSVNLVQGGFGNTNGIGSYGGYGGIYCFALQP